MEGFEDQIRAWKTDERLYNFSVSFIVVAHCNFVKESHRDEASIHSSIITQVVVRVFLIPDQLMSHSEETLKESHLYWIIQD